MNSDIVDLRSFYSSLLGRLAERSIAMAISSVLANLPRERLVGLGCTLRPGSTVWSRCRSCLRLHAGDARGSRLARRRAFRHRAGLRRGIAAGRFLDHRMLVVHSLEHAESPRETLKEVWRVLSQPAGVSSSSYPTGAASGPVSSTRRSAPAGRFCAPNSTNFYAKPISRRPPGPTRCSLSVVPNGVS